MMQSTKYNDVTAGKPEGPYGSGKYWMQQLELMQNDKGLRSGSDGRKPFTTIDDLVEKAGELLTGLKKLSESKHPLGVRRARVIRKGVEKSMNAERESRQIKGSGRTYFLDIEKTKEGKNYLRITESRKGEGDKWERSSVNVFPEDINEFASAVSEMASELK